MTHTRHITAFLAASLSLSLATAACDDDADFAPIVHTHSADAAGIFVNAYLVETETGIVAIDTMLTVSDAKALRSHIDSFDKPLLAVLITHGHPDHYNGTIELIAGRPDVPVIATQGVYDVIAADDEAKEAQWTPVFGDEWPSERAFPTRIVNDGDTVTFDQVSFTVHELGQGESHFDTYWVMAPKGGAPEAAFLGDVVFNGVHSYLSDGHSSDWLANIERLRQDLSSAATLYPGHGEPGSLALLDQQEAYLELYRDSVAELAGSGTTISEEAKAELVRIMKAYLPTDALEFLIGLGADAVAAEMAGAAN